MPNPVTYFCEYTKDYVFRMYNMVRTGTLLQMKVSQIEKFLQIKYTDNIVIKVMRDLDFTDEVTTYRAFVDRFS